MSESKLRELSMDFSVDIIELVKHLKSMKESIIANKSEEASETGYWIELYYTELNILMSKHSKHFLQNAPR